MLSCKRFPVLLLFMMTCLGASSQLSVPTWVKQVKGLSGESIPSAVITDKQNNVYAYGFFAGGNDFSTSAVPAMLVAKGQYGLYVAKYDADGNLLWVKQIDGSSWDQANTAIAIDSRSNITIIGQHTSTDIDADPGPAQHIIGTNGGWDGFIIQLNSNGDLVWARDIGGNGTDYIHKVCVDKDDNVIISGEYTQSFTIDNITMPTVSAQKSGMIVKFDRDGHLTWALAEGVVGNTEVHGLGVDASGNIEAAIYSSTQTTLKDMAGTSFASRPGASTTLVKFSPAGNYTWSASILGNVSGNNTSITFDSENNAYLYAPCANSSSLTFYESNRIVQPVGAQDVFIAKYSPAGQNLWVKSIGYPGASIFTYGIIMSKDDYIYCSGFFDHTIDFDPSASGKALVTYHGGQDLYLAKYDKDGNYKWAFGAGPPNCTSTMARNVTVDENNDVLLVGAFCGTVNFDASNCSTYFLTAISSSRDSFIGKYSQAKPSAALQIDAFSVPGQLLPATIDNTLQRITIYMQKGASVTSLAPTVTAPAGVTVSPASGVAADFSGAMTYKLTNASCGTLNYAVIVTYIDNTNTAVGVCSSDASVLNGAPFTGTALLFEWQQNVNGSWIIAPGAATQRDYTFAGVVNAGPTPVQLSFRRKVADGATTYLDSWYTVTVGLKSTVTNNTITIPDLAGFCSNVAGSAAIAGSDPAGGSAPYGYQWQQSADNSTFTDIAGATAKSYAPPVTFGVTMYYRRSVSSSGACGAPSLSNTVTWRVDNTAVAPAISPVAICAGEAATLSIAVPIAAYTYRWYAPDHSLAGSGGVFTTPPLSAAVTYYADAVTPGGCVSPQTAVNVSVTARLGSPVATLTSHKPSSLTFHWTAVAGASGYEVSTDGGATYSVVAAGTLDYVVDNLQPAAAVTLLVRALGTTACATSSPAAVTGVTDTTNIFVPNAFSPNGDGNNDILYVYGGAYKSFSFQIFDQWGKLLFRSDEPSAGWDGTYAGTIQPAGVYTYMLRYIDLQGAAGSTKGTLMLMR